MLDIKFIRQNPKLVEEKAKQKGYDVDIDKLLKVDEDRRKLIEEVDKVRSERKKAAEARDEKKGQQLKKELKEKENLLEKAHEEFYLLIREIPNLAADDAPIGKDESENKVVKQVGQAKKFDFHPRDHLQLGTALDILDFENGAKVAGSGFYYLKNEGARLELALVNYGIDFLIKKGFAPVITPDLARAKFYEGTGYLPRGPEAQTYMIADSDLGLIATAEVTLAGLHTEETLSEKDLPRKYAGYSHCFRKESGSYGKYSKGLYRVHQFTKVEMYIYCQPDDSNKMHQELLETEKEFFSSLEIPYRVVEMCTGDLGSQASKKFDLEAWMPGRGDWGEITSTSNTTDYQARRLNIRYKKGNSTEYVHTLNGTLMATSRTLIAILENYQAKDGSILIPKALQKYTGFAKIPSKI